MEGSWRDPRAVQSLTRMDARAGICCACLIFPGPLGTHLEKKCYSKEGGGGWASQASLSYEIEKWLNLRAV